MTINVSAKVNANVFSKKAWQKFIKLRYLKSPKHLLQEGLPPPPYAISPVHSAFLLFAFFQCNTLLEKMQQGRRSFYTQKKTRK